MVGLNEIWSYLDEVGDPEIPVISVVDLGIVRHVGYDAEGRLSIHITPTYSGCPAFNEMSTAIRLKLMEKGLRDFDITTQLTPAWSTDWMSEKGREKLRAFGIAPPLSVDRGSSFDSFFMDDPHIPCPQCHSLETSKISEFGSTPCKALFQCENCHEPFDYFKCHR